MQCGEPAGYHNWRGGGGNAGGGEHDADRRQQLKTSLAFFPT